MPSLSLRFDSRTKLLKRIGDDTLTTPIPWEVYTSTLIVARRIHHSQRQQLIKQSLGCCKDTAKLLASYLAGQVELRIVKSYTRNIDNPHYD